MKPAGRTTFPYKNVKENWPLEKWLVERAYWFELPESTYSSPYYAIFHVHFTGLWVDYQVPERQRDALRYIGQINVRNSTSTPPADKKDPTKLRRWLWGAGEEGTEWYFRVWEENDGQAVFSHKRDGGEWDTREMFPRNSPPMREWLEKLRVIDRGHPIRRSLGSNPRPDISDGPAYKRQKCNVEFIDSAVPLVPSPNRRDVHVLVSAQPAHTSAHLQEAVSEGVAISPFGSEVYVSRGSWIAAFVFLATVSIYTMGVFNMALSAYMYSILLFSIVLLVLLQQARP